MAGRFRPRRRGLVALSSVAGLLVVGWLAPMPWLAGHWPRVLGSAVPVRVRGPAPGRARPLGGVAGRGGRPGGQGPAGGRAAQAPERRPHRPAPGGRRGGRDRRRGGHLAAQVFEILSASVRTTSHRPPVGPAGSSAALQVRQADVNAAVTVLARRAVLAGDPPLDLSGSLLAGRGSAGPGWPGPTCAAPTSPAPASSTPSWPASTWSSPCSAAPSSRAPTCAGRIWPGPGRAPTPAGRTASTGAPPASAWSKPAEPALGKGGGDAAGGPVGQGHDRQHGVDAAGRREQ